LRKLTVLVLLVAVMVALFATASVAVVKVITDTNKHNLLYGSRHRDLINGLEGPGAIWSWRGSDTLFGGPGVDDMFGGRGPDYVTGDKGRDNLWGNPGPDTIMALDDYRDYVNCGPGVDRIYIDDTKEVKAQVFMKNKKCEFVNGVDTREEK
jgi:Ca2+-binding RTX toxin-like protein